MTTCSARLGLALLFVTSTAIAQSPVAPAGPAPATGFGRVPRLDFNRLAVELNLPLFWVTDANGDGNLDPAEVAAVWGMGAKTPVWAKGGAFTPELKKAYEAIAARHAAGSALPKGLPAPEAARQKAVLEELAQGRPTLVHNDLSGLEPGEKKLVEAVMKASAIIEKLYARQLGMDAFEAKLPKDPASRALFWRNQSFGCAAPRTQNNPDCTAIPGAPKTKQSGLYPKVLLAKEGFCEELSKRDKALMDPFVVVAEDQGGFKAVPYNQVWKKEMAQVSAVLDGAAKAVDPAKEAALKSYLEAAAKSFLTNDWAPADEAWAKMSVSNSRWYLRIGPDEVYAEPCNTKALFHVSFARINQASLKWQTLLDPLKGELEAALAALAGPPYAARKVSFHLPDFIDIVLNAGDSRDPAGATIGQSLPNFGAVANEGRGRTVAMTNLYTDADSVAQQKQTAQALLCPDAMALWTPDPEPQVMSVVLHEAAHNLGPSHQYKVDGKVDREQFGGALASTMEELKAQSSALHFTDWLAERKHITAEMQSRAHVRDLLWSFGHISRGMYDENKAPRSYSQLAAIQLGFLMRGGAVTWKKDASAANGQDKGCFSMDLKKFPEVAKGLLKAVAGIKAHGDKAGAEKLLADDVDVTGEKKALHEVITERALRAPKSSFLYSVGL